MKNKVNGITLIEALIALVILSIGISSAMVVVLRSSHSARQAEAKIQAENVASNVVERYWAAGTIELPNSLKSKYQLSVAEVGNCKHITLVSKSDPELEVKRLVTDQCKAVEAHDT